MREESESISKLDILCIGEIQAGKSYFLKRYTKNEIRQDLLDSYEIFVKKVNNNLVYFHQLNEEETLYLETKYDGILFFVDLVGTWNVVENILKWMEIQSKLTGRNIYKIPLRIIVTKTREKYMLQKWKKSLEQQLKSLVEPHQIIYFQNIQTIEQPLQNFFKQICQQKAEGIKCTTINQVKLYGLSEFIKTHINSAKLIFFRWYEVFDKNVRHRINFNVKIPTQ